MSITIKILGSGAALPTGKRNPTSQYVFCENRHILIDCGEGTQLQMRKYGVKIQKLTHIFISHLHGDHYFGLVGLLSSMLLLGRNQGVYIYAPKGLKEIVLMQLEIGGHKLTFDINFIEIDTTIHSVLYEDKVIKVESFPLNHRIPTSGFLIVEKEKERKILGDILKENSVSLEAIPFFRNSKDYIDENGTIFPFEEYTVKGASQRKYAYCSDTKYSEKILPYISNVEILYHEATFADDMKDRAKSTYHSTASQAAKIASLANVKTLLMGHLSARYEDVDRHLLEAKMIFSNSYYVNDGDSFNIK